MMRFEATRFEKFQHDLAAEATARDAKIIVHGYADPTEGTSSDDARLLSAQRAATIREKLVSLGIRTGDIIEVANGWTARAADEKPSMNRRVDVVVDSERASIGLLRESPAIDSDVLARLEAAARGLVHLQVDSRGCQYATHPPHLKFSFSSPRLSVGIDTCLPVDEPIIDRITDYYIRAVDQKCVFDQSAHD